MWGLQKGKEAAYLLPCLQEIFWEVFRLFSLQRNGQAVSLYVAVLQGGLWTVGSVALHATELQGGFQTARSVVLYAVELLGGRQTIMSVAQLPSCPVAQCAMEHLGCLQAVVSSGEQRNWRSALAEGIGQEGSRIWGLSVWEVMGPESTLLPRL